MFTVLTASSQGLGNSHYLNSDMANLYAKIKTIIGILLFFVILLLLVLQLVFGTVSSYLCNSTKNPLFLMCFVIAILAIATALAIGMLLVIRMEKDNSQIDKQTAAIANVVNKNNQTMQQSSNTNLLHNTTRRIAATEKKTDNNSDELGLLEDSVRQLGQEHNAVRVYTMELGRTFNEDAATQQRTNELLQSGVNDSQESIQSLTQKVNSNHGNLEAKIFDLETSTLLNLTAARDETDAKFVQSDEAIRVNKEVTDAQLQTQDGRITANKADLQTQDSRITANKAELDGKITANKAEIDTNKADLQAQDGRITANKADLQTQDGRITANKAEIDTNKTDLQTQDGRITANKAEIDTNKTDLQAQDGRITQNKTELDGKITANKAEIDTNKADLQAQDGRITQNKTDLQAQDGRITQNKTDLQNQDGRITQNKTDLQNQDGRITQNKTDLQNQDGRITQNKTDLQNQDGRITQNKTDLQNQDGRITTLEAAGGGSYTPHLKQDLYEKLAEYDASSWCPKEFPVVPKFSTVALLGTKDEYRMQAINRMRSLQYTFKFAQENQSTFKTCDYLITMFNMSLHRQGNLAMTDPTIESAIDKDKMSELRDQVLKMPSSDIKDFHSIMLTLLNAFYEWNMYTSAFSRILGYYLSGSNSWVHKIQQNFSNFDLMLSRINSIHDRLENNQIPLRADEVVEMIEDIQIFKRITNTMRHAMRHFFCTTYNLVKLRKMASLLMRELSSNQLNTELRQLHADQAEQLIIYKKPDVLSQEAAYMRDNDAQMRITLVGTNGSSVGQTQADKSSEVLGKIPETAYINENPSLMKSLGTRIEYIHELIGETQRILERLLLSIQQ